MSLVAYFLKHSEVYDIYIASPHQTCVNPSAVLL